MVLRLRQDTIVLRWTQGSFEVDSKSFQIGNSFEMEIVFEIDTYQVLSESQICTKLQIRGIFDDTYSLELCPPTKGEGGTFFSGFVTRYCQGH